MLSFFKNQKNTLFFIKSFFFSFIFLALFSLLSFVTFSKIYDYQNFNFQESSNEMISQAETYTIYQNTDPVIHKIELFLAKNKDQLDSEELIQIEKLRSKRITELMVKKYSNTINSKKE